MMRGIVSDMEDGTLHVSVDKGYSFCNCWNIFYTDWKNIDQQLYDKGYYEKYQCEDAERLARIEATKFIRLFRKLNPNAKTLFEVGSIHDYFLDNFEKSGYEVSGIDITEHKSKYNIEIGNFENRPTSGIHFEYGSMDFKKYDIIWASHVFEHFKDPNEQLYRLKDMLAENGLLYIAMPDTFFIDFEHKNPLGWDWGVQEHHILWGMDSFIEYAATKGFRCLFAERNTDLNQKKDQSWFWKRDFKVVLTHA